MEAVQRNHAAPLGVDQEDAVVLARVGHREDAARVAGQEVSGVELRHARTLQPFGRRARS